MIRDKKYFITKINVNKGQDFISWYHYSHHASIGSKYTLGIFRVDTEELVGVAQLGWSGANNIKLDRYVKEPIEKAEYLELNRFAMADSEEKNSESQAISLIIKWIKKNLPFVRLLVSYSGRKEGNYGYIYQATNWEYLGYFVSDGFWQLDGEEYHHISVCVQQANLGKKGMSCAEAMCDIYHDVRRIKSKQLIYIMRLDKTLTPANEPLPYPKKETCGSIVMDLKIYKQNDEWLKKHPVKRSEPIKFYYDKNEPYKSTGHTHRKRKSIKIAVYDITGALEGTYKSFLDAKENMTGDWDNALMGQAAKNNKLYKEKYFVKVDENDGIPQHLDVKPICTIEGIPMYTRKAIETYTKSSRQYVCAAIKSKPQKIKGKDIIWV